VFIGKKVRKQQKVLIDRLIVYLVFPFCFGFHRISQVELSFERKKKYIVNPFHAAIQGESSTSLYSTKSKDSYFNRSQKAWTTLMMALQ